MQRRSFLAGAATTTAFHILPSRRVRAAHESMVFGHQSKRYRVVEHWGKLDPSQTPVTHCHEFVEDSQGRLILFQTHVKNNIIIYDKSGKLISTWGTQFEGAHGMALVHENGEDFLFLTDTRGKVFKTDLNGRVIFELGRPVESGKYPTAVDSGQVPKYSPTHVMPAPDGTFFVGDGYGSDYILRYSHEGKFLDAFGGKGTRPEDLNNVHGGMVDTSDPSQPVLILCSRADHALKLFTLDGKHLKNKVLPGLRLCQIKKQGDFYFAPSLNGIVSVLDQNLDPISHLGGSAPEKDDDGNWKPCHQVDLQGEAITASQKKNHSLFIHPHGLWADSALNLYVAQWNSGNSYPIRLEPVN